MKITIEEYDIDGSVAKRAVIDTDDEPETHVYCSAIEPEAEPEGEGASTEDGIPIEALRSILNGMFS